MTLSPFIPGCRGPLCSQNEFHIKRPLRIWMQHVPRNLPPKLLLNRVYILSTQTTHDVAEEINPSKISSQHLYQSTLTKPPPQQKTHGFLTFNGRSHWSLEVVAVLCFSSLPQCVPTQKKDSGSPHFRKGTQPGVRYLEGKGSWRLSRQSSEKKLEKYIVT